MEEELIERKGKGERKGKEKREERKGGEEKDHEEKKKKKKKKKGKKLTKLIAALLGPRLRADLLPAPATVLTDSWITLVRTDISQKKQKDERTKKKQTKNC